MPQTVVWDEIRGVHPLRAMKSPYGNRGRGWNFFRKKSRNHKSPQAGRNSQVPRNQLTHSVTEDASLKAREDVRNAQVPITGKMSRSRTRLLMATLCSSYCATQRPPSAFPLLNPPAS